MNAESKNLPEEPDDTDLEVNASEDTEKETPRKDSITQRWWWSNALQTVIGAVVALLQLDFITGEGGVWLNWVVFILGGLLFVTGVIGLLRAYKRHRTDVVSQ